ncbi:MAG: TerC family protein [Minwuia sp.]|uniref:TerC family protein n=1 Tax=Minwuia sp. TaxID=2493630 RepID=UPI003A87612F
MLELLSDPSVWASLATLTALEIVLGIDNLVFLSIVTNKLPVHQQKLAQRIGLGLALGMRIALLSMIVWIVGLTAPLFEAWGHVVSWRDIIMLGGGLFLLGKGTYEIHHQVEGGGGEESAGSATLTMAIVQIVILDAVFSLDSVITAVGMTDQLPVMIAAVTIAMAVMLFAAGPVATFIEKHPTAKMLALSFLLLVGVTLIADGMHFHIPRGFLYFAIAFSILVEALNLWAKTSAEKRRKREREIRGG